MENLENETEESVCAGGSKKSQEFLFLLLMVTPLAICIRLYVKELMQQWYAGQKQGQWRLDPGSIRALY